MFLSKNNGKLPARWLFIAIFAIVMITVVPVLSQSADSAPGDTLTLDNTMCTYTDNGDGTATIISFFQPRPENPVTNIIIPGEIAGLTITGIAAGVFSGHQIRSVQFGDQDGPSEIKTIGANAFMNNLLTGGIKTIAADGTVSPYTFPETLESLGTYAFYGCTGLTSLDLLNLTAVKALPMYCFSSISTLETVLLPPNLETMGNSLFSGCSSLSELKVPSGVTSIGAGAFSALPANAKIDLSDFAPGDLSGAPWSGFNTRIFWKPNPAVDAETYPLLFNPETGRICGIQQYLLDGTTLMTSANAPEEAKNVTIPSSYTIDGVTYEVKTLMTGAFGSMPANGSTTVKDGVLTTITFPQSMPTMTVLDEFMFHTCELTAVNNLPDSVEGIGQYAFYSCSGLKTINSPSEGAINLPASIRWIGQHAFNGCSKIATVNSTVDGVIDIPSSVTSVGWGTFSTMSGTRLNIPTSISSMNEAFRSMPNITTVHFTGDDIPWPKTATNMFADCSKLVDIYIPQVSRADWENTYKTTQKSPWGAPNEQIKVHWKDEVELGPIRVDDTGKWQYHSKTGTIIKYLGETGIDVEVIVPSQLTTDGVKTNITTVGYSGVAKGNLKSLTFSDGITTIAGWAFGNVHIGTLDLGNTVKTIGVSAFHHSDIHTLMPFPETLTTIGSTAFSYQQFPEDTAIILPSSVTSVAQNSFSSNPNLVQITIEQNRNPGINNGYPTAVNDVKNNAPFLGNPEGGVPDPIAVIYMDDPHPVFDESRMTIVPNPDGSNTAILTVYTKMNTDTTLTGIANDAGDPALDSFYLSPIGNGYTRATMIVGGTDGSNTPPNGNGTYGFVVEYGGTGYTKLYYYTIPHPGVTLFHTLSFADGAASLSDPQTFGDLPTSSGDSYVWTYDGIILPSMNPGDPLSDSNGTMTKTYIGSPDAKAMFIGWGTVPQSAIFASLEDRNTYTDSNMLYNAGDPFTIPSVNSVLYAIWVEDLNNNGIEDYDEDPFTVLYNPNSATSGTVPPGVEDMPAGEYALAGNVGNLAKINHLFMGWSQTVNPIPLGLSATQDDVDALVTSVIILDENDFIGSNRYVYNVYAVWAQDSNNNDIPDFRELNYSIVYNDPNKTGGTVPQTLTECLSGLRYFIDTANAGSLVKAGHILLGWSSSPEIVSTLEEAENVLFISEVVLTTEQVIALPESEGVRNYNLYAVWAVDSDGNGIPDYEEATFSVTYDINGGDSGSGPATETGILNGTRHTLNTATVPTHADADGIRVVFAGWSASMDATIYEADAAPPSLITSMVISADTTVYAVWKYAPAESERHYFILASADTNSSITPNGKVSVAEGSNVTFTFLAMEGYRIVSVTVDGTSLSAEEIESGSYTFYSVNRSHIIDVMSGEDIPPVDVQPEPPQRNPQYDGPADDMNWAWWLVPALVLLFLILLWLRSGLFITAMRDDEKVPDVLIAYIITGEDGEKVAEDTVMTNSRGKCRIKAKKKTTVSLTSAVSLPLAVEMEHRREHAQILIK